MSLFTKQANAIFSPVDAAGAPRSVLNGDAQVWGTEVESYLNDLDDRIVDKIAGSAIIILATGQSNIDNSPPMNWSPPANLFYWNATYLSPGTAIAPVNAATMRLSYSFAAEIAKANPANSVYIVNIGKGSTPIKNWISGSGVSPDMYAGCKQGVEALLAQLGATKIDHILWYQGESDYIAGSTTYVRDLDTVWHQFVNESWFPRETPITIMSVANAYLADLNMRSFNNTLRYFVNLEPQLRTFVDTSIIATSNWDEAGLHLTAEGYRQAGILAYKAAFEGMGAGRQSARWQTVFKKSNTTRSATVTLANDPELSIQLLSGRTYRIRGSIYYQAPPACDLKYGFVGPAAVLVWSKLRVTTGEAPTAQTIDSAFASAYPTNKTVLQSANSNGIIEFDMLLASTSADAVFSFQWAQNTSTADVLRIFSGSYFEILDVAY